MRLRDHGAVKIRLLHGLTLTLALAIGGAVAWPSAAEAAPGRSAVSCKRGKAKKAKKLTAKTIRRWEKKGWSDEKIVKKAQARAYKVTKKERKRLTRYKVSAPLIAALAATDAPVAKARLAPATPAARQPIDLETTIDPNDIDFDSVPPPEGMDMRFADAHRAEGG